MNPANHNLEILALNDSRVVLGAVVKGRSSNRKLNGILRAMIPHLVVSGISLSLLWVETEATIADAPSRFRSLPAPLHLFRLPGGYENLVSDAEVEHYQGF